MNMTIAGALEQIELNMQEGVVKKHFTIAGKDAKITQKQYAHRLHSSLMVN